MALRWFVEMWEGIKEGEIVNCVEVIRLLIVSKLKIFSCSDQEAMT